MKYLVLFCCLYCQFVTAQKLPLVNAVFKTGDNMQWTGENFNDKAWAPIQLNNYWEKQGYDKYDGFGWYRIHFNLPASLKEKAVLKDLLEVFFPGIDDADVTYLNGVEIGRTGRLPDDPNGYKSGGRIRERHYIITADNPLLNWDKENVIAIRVYDGGGTGGIFGDEHFIRFLEPIDYISMDSYANTFEISNKKISKEIVFNNRYHGIIKGRMSTTVTWNDSVVGKYDQAVQLTPGKSQVVINNLPMVEAAKVNFVFTEDIRNQRLQAIHEIPYILTPKEKPAPKIHNPAITGCKPGVPFLFTIAATGTRPIRFQVSGLPKGLVFDEQKGQITGSIINEGKYSVTITAKNKFGKDVKSVNLFIGNDKVLLTLPWVGVAGTVGGCLSAIKK